jgi:hypothetical protein
LLRAANARLRGVVEAKGAEREALWQVKDAEIARLRALVDEAGLRIAELDRRQGRDSTNSSTPSWKDSIAAQAKKRADRSSRVRSSERQLTRPHP